MANKKQFIGGIIALLLSGFAYYHKAGIINYLKKKL
jgi:hypothetical protein